MELSKKVEALFNNESKSIDYHIETNYLETIKMMVSIGLGWAVLPRSMLDKQLQALNLGSIKITRDLGLIYHEKRTLSNAANAFLATIENQI